MLSRSDNERLTQVGPGTPAGEWLRRYWLPVAISDAWTGMRSMWESDETFTFQGRTDTTTNFGRRLAEFNGKPTRIRVLGEDLVLFRDGSGRLGLFELRCPHRGASFEFGRVKADGLECLYHGWKFDVGGRCLSQPTEPPGSNFCEKVRNVAYPVREMGGLVWTYMGPGESPVLPLFDVLTDESCFRSVECQGLWPANYLQIIEQVPDVIHTSTLHGYDGSECRDIWNQLPDISWEEGEYGLISRQVRGEHRRGSYHLMPIFTRLVPPWPRPEVDLPERQAFVIWLPVDDTHTLLFEVVATPYVDGKVPVLPEGLSYAVSKEIQVVLDQDYKALVSQGDIRDRTEEQLGASDRGVTMLRKMMLRQIKAVEEGRDPMNVWRPPDRKGRLAFKDICIDTRMAALS
jgi:5,5'-dehydrodivanillate O-demethylase oxygenase subunit